MYILASNIWFTKLMKQFFFWIDKIVFNFISIIYDVMISIARTSVFTQSDISQMADRIYKLLAIFMVFKVTLSLITYVVNPDDFSDKSKGVSKLGINIVISMALLILTPYIFSYAYQFQTIVLEDNSLGVLIFGGDEANESFFNTAGDKIAYTTMTPFFTPNTSIEELIKCTTLVKDGKFNSECSEGLTSLENDNFTEQTRKNYIAGVENGVLGLMFRQEMAVATYETEDDETEFVMEYKFIFSTVTGVIIILLLITFCMDIAVRSIKLAFLQLVAPIPIISYVDPKSGKDGLFKKWYEMCIKTFLSLFIRLIALYFAVFIISKVADLKLVDVVDGSYVRNGIISIFIIIGALMFAKQLPKMLEGLGIKLDSGSFTLNPLRKMEKEALGGKILKKPNDALAKFGKGVAMAPLNGLATFGKKSIGAIDAARHGKGLKQGWNRTHGKLYNNFYKKLDEWAPDSAESRKNERLGREEVAKMHRNWTEGEKVYQKMDNYGYNDKSLDGVNQNAYKVAGFKGKFLDSKMKLDKETEKQKMLRQLNSAAATNPGGLKAAIDELSTDEQKNLTKYFGEGYVDKLKNMTNTEFAKTLDTQEKTVSGLEKVHESIRKQDGKQADLEDQLKFVKYNQIDPTESNDSSRRSILMKETKSTNSSSVEVNNAEEGSNEEAEILFDENTESNKETNEESASQTESDDKKEFKPRYGGSFDERLEFAKNKLDKLFDDGASKEEIDKQSGIVRHLELNKDFYRERERQLAEEAKAKKDNDD